MGQPCKYPDGSVYIGEWNDRGEKHGIGRLIFPDSSKYVGEFKHGISDGHGVLTSSDGSVFEGEFAKGKFQGYGVYTQYNGMKYEGQFHDGEANGKGLVTFPDGTHGIPRNEGIFENYKLKKSEKVYGHIHKATQAAIKAKQISSQ